MVCGRRKRPEHFHLLPVVEYGLIIVLIAIAVITALTGVGKNLTDKFDEIGKAIGGAQTP